MPMSFAARLGWRGAMLFVWLAGSLSAAPVLEGPPARQITDPRSLISPGFDGARPVSIADLFYVRDSLDAAWARDSKRFIVSTNLTGRFNLWSVAAGGAFPTQLTQSDDRQMGIAASPDGKWIVFESDHGGDEIFDLYAVPVAGGAVVNLTHSDEISETAALFSHDGALLAFDHRLKSGASNNVAVMDFAIHAVRVLTHETSPNMQWHVVGFSGDGRSIIANRSSVEGTEGTIWRVDVATGAATPALAAGVAGFNSASDVSPDGRWLALTTETSAGVLQAAVYDMQAKKYTLIKPDVWEQKSGRFAPDGRSVLMLSNVEGRDVVYSYEAGSGHSEPLNLPAGVNSDESGKMPAFSPDGTRILFPHRSGNTPLDYWVLDRSTGKSAPVTRFAPASIDPAKLPGTQIVHYRSADGTVISALLWLPYNLARSGHAPAIVLPHGGPTGQAVDEFDPAAVAFVSRGYVVLAPNPRGSTGFGRAFELANRRDLGGGDLADYVAGARFLVDTGYVDARRIGIAGISYGGYMTLMALSKTPEVWAAGVESCGITDWRSVYELGSPMLRQYLVGLLGDPVKDKAVYAASSPLTYLAHVRAPLLALGGGNDIRVPPEEAEQVVKSLREAGKAVDTKVYAGEGHGFYKRENQIDALERTVAWFDRYMGGEVEIHEPQGPLPQ
jgi:Tol biopolymer transport system component/dienelactone hydrolase